MTRDFLDRLDDAVDGRCACGCGAGITEASPSAWFAAEPCANRWHRQAPPEMTVGELMCRVAATFREAFEAAVAALVDVFETIAAAVRSFVDALDPYCDAVLDFREPPPLPRPLGHVNPPGGINARPLGRPAFRPRY